MGDEIYRGWGLRGKIAGAIKRSFSNIGTSKEARQVSKSGSSLMAEFQELGLTSDAGRSRLAGLMARDVLETFDTPIGDVTTLPFYRHLQSVIAEFLSGENAFRPPDQLEAGRPLPKSEVWALDDELNAARKVLDNFDEIVGDLVQMFRLFVAPLIKANPSLLLPNDEERETLTFPAPLTMVLNDFPEIVEQMVQIPFAPELSEYGTTDRLRGRLEYNLIIASGGMPGDPSTHPRIPRLPTKAPAQPEQALIKTYLGGTALAELLNYSVPITIPEDTRFEHQHIVAGSGHGKTQTLQHLILHDLQKVAAGDASIVVIDSQGDLIRNISGLSVFAPGNPMADRLVVIDPTDVEYPVALNLFDVGMERINQYSRLDRERMVNGVLELYDFVLGSLLDAAMTQKQSVIFRYITRLMLHIPNATIITLRELLEDGGAEKYRPHIEELSGSARAFFETEFDSREFVQTKKQVLRRLWGILENQSFERMFLHPRNKLDLFSEMNRGKVILINTAKDLLKEDGTTIFGRFFIAMIAQAAQERSVIPQHQRMPTFVYIDEAHDYFDRNVGIILEQARKFKVGMILAHQYLGQLDGRLQEAVFANTSIKLAGGVSAKDARALAGEMRTDANFIEKVDKLTFAAFIRGTTKTAVSLSIVPGTMERLPHMNADERMQQRAVMRERYAVHYEDATYDQAPKENGTFGGDKNEPSGKTRPDQSSKKPDDPLSDKPADWP